MTFPLTLIFMFLVFWRPQEWLFPWLYGFPLLNVLMIVAIMSLAIETSQNKAQFPKTPMVKITVGLWLATIFSHVPHTYFQGIVDTIPQSFKLCFFTVLLLVVVNRAERARQVVLVLVAGAVVMSIHCIMQKRLGHGFAWAGPLWVFKPDVGWVARSQFFGIFGDPNDTAQFLAAALPLVFAYPKRLNPVSIFLSTGVAFVILQGLLTTHSRGGMVGLSAAVFCMIFMRLPTRILPYAGAMALLAYLVLCAVQGNLLLDASAHERVVFWGMANWRFKHNLLFGLGYGMFWEVIPGSRAAHNAFVSCYTELGVFGYWFWFGLLQLSLVGVWRARVALRRVRTPVQAYMRRLCGLSLAALVAYSAGGFFLSRAFIFPFFFLFGLLGAITMITQDLLPEGHPPLLDWQRDVMIACTVGCLFSITYIYVSIVILNKAFYG
jgi:hypothetical protein